MGLEALAVRLSKHRRAMDLVGLIVAVTGVSMVLNPTHWTGMEWIGLPILVAGAALLARTAWPRGARPAGETRSLGARLLWWLTWDGRLVRMFPVVGIALIVGDLTYNFLLSASPALLTEDTFVLLTAAALVTYGFVPVRYGRERDFVLLFFLFLDALLVVPLLLSRVVAGNVDASVDVYTWTALAPELSGLLSVLGVSNSVHSVTGYSAPGMTFTPLQMSIPVTLVIATSCSGIYSFGIFASACAAYLLTEYERPSGRLWLVMVLGFLASYVANLLRMVVIVLVGYYTDSAQSELQNLLLAHSYAGWIIFLAWLALFWGVLFKFLPSETRTTEFAPVSQAPRVLHTESSRCRICGEALSPTIAAARCACGAYYHNACLGTDAQCPSCHRDISPKMGNATGVH